MEVVLLEVERMGKCLTDAVSTSGILLKFYILFTSSVASLFWHVLMFDTGSKEGI